MHHTAAHRYDPQRAGIPADPFWEFVSGPAHAGAFPASPLDPTFVPEPVFARGAPCDNVSPAEGFQHFGEVTISGGRFRVDLRDQDGAALWSTTLDSGRATGSGTGFEPDSTTSSPRIRGP